MNTEIMDNYLRRSTEKAPPFFAVRMTDDGSPWVISYGWEISDETCRGLTGMPMKEFRCLLDGPRRSRAIATR